MSNSKKKIKVTAKPTIRNMFAFIQGNIRYHIYYKYKWLKWIVPDYIWDQIRFRLLVMDQECYDLGQCKKCGCETTKLQFANKSCDGKCYPPIMSKKQWNEFMKIQVTSINGHRHCFIEKDVNRTSYVRFVYYIDGQEVHQKIIPNNIKTLLYGKSI
jgi:hypothetical protein